MNPNNLEHAGEVLLLICAFVVLFVAIWASRARIPRSFYKKYPRRLLFRAMFPFVYAWRAQFQGDDILVIEKARARSSVLSLTIVIIMQLIALAFYLQAVALLARCETQTIEQSAHVPSPK